MIKWYHRTDVKNSQVPKCTAEMSALSLEDQPLPRPSSSNVVVPAVSKPRFIWSEISGFKWPDLGNLASRSSHVLRTYTYRLTQSAKSPPNSHGNEKSNPKSTIFTWPVWGVQIIRSWALKKMFFVAYMTYMFSVNSSVNCSALPCDLPTMKLASSPWPHQSIGWAVVFFLSVSSEQKL